FAELAPVMARFVRTFHSDLEYDPDKLARFQATLRPGLPEAGGQDLFKEALGHYYESIFESRPKRKAELVLLGNIKIGLHEQTRLQPDIVAALDAPLRVGLDGLLSGGLVARAGRLLPGAARGLWRAQLRAAEQLLAERFTVVFRRL